MLDKVTQTELKRVLVYEPDTGLFRWVITKGSTAQKGNVAGTISKSTGYRVVRINDRLYLQHRLVWLYVHGHWPDAQIDHIDMDRTNNKLSNLREATFVQQKHNRARLSTNLSGLKGVSRNPPGWMARIRVNGKQLHLGTFSTPEDAHAAYVAAAGRFFGEYARTA